MMCCSMQIHSFSLSTIASLYIHLIFFYFFLVGFDVDSGAKVCVTRWPKIWTTMKHGSLAADARLLGMPRIRFHSTLICFTLLCLFFFRCWGMPFSLSDFLKINQNVLFVLFFYFIIFFFFLFVQGSRTVWLLSSWNVGYVAGRRHGVDWHARSVHLARHGVCRLRVGRLPTPWQDTLLRTANSGSFARRQI